MAADLPYVYPCSHGEALRRGEGEHHDSSFRLNVQCARDIEDAIRAHFHEADGSLGEQCAQSVLEKFGFKRVNFVLANSLEELRRSACKHLICDETYLWGLFPWTVCITAITRWTPPCRCWRRSSCKPERRIRRWGCSERSTALAAEIRRTTPARCLY